MFRERSCRDGKYSEEEEENQSEALKDIDERNLDIKSNVGGCV